MMTTPSAASELKNGHIRRTLRALDATLAGLTPAEISRRPAQNPAGKWNIAEVLEHLAITYASTARMLAQVAQAGETRATRASLRRWIFATVVTRLGYMPAGREAPAFTRPKGKPPEEMLQKVRENLIAMDASLEACAARFGPRVKIADHPILGPLNAWQWGRFHWVHTQHHLKQIARLRTMHGK